MSSSWIAEGRPIAAAHRRREEPLPVAMFSSGNG